MVDAHRELSPKEAAERLHGALRGFRDPLTVADAAARAGLPLRAAERGLFVLLERYPSTLTATSEGELLFRFPNGLSRLRHPLSRLRRWGQRLVGVAAGVGRFLLRAWISVVLIGYAGAFIALMLGLTFAKQNDSDDHGPGIEVVYVLLRVISEALFWTFHPFSPFSMAAMPARPVRGRRQRRARADEVPFYEKVNRFVFGPEPPRSDAQALERALLAEIRAGRGRIGLSDVMRITGLPRVEAEPMLARLMLDYDGEVDVSEAGGITYRFPSLRKTAGESAPLPGRAFAFSPRSMAPLTGNSSGFNVLLTALNGFNWFASLFALSNHLSLANLERLFAGFPLDALPNDGIPWVFGLIPFVFSSAIFALPIWRALRRPREQQKLQRENGRWGLFHRVVEKMRRAAPGAAVTFSEGELQAAWASAAGEPPRRHSLVRETLALGGMLEVDEISGRSAYRFVDFEAELAALAEERASASDEEMAVGHAIFLADESPRGHAAPMGRPSGGPETGLFPPEHAKLDPN